jgi:3-hydroxyisobutyrate dehydrogenase-like beta-hydroxyacid dehydrogenase
MDVGFIGLGNMGTAMVKSLLKRGHNVIGWNRTLQNAEELRSSGVRVARSIAEACSTGVVITMLANDAAVEAVVFGKGGVLDSLVGGGVHISMSTIGLASVGKLTKAHQERGQKFISAPVLGRPEAAEQARLFILPAGEKESVERCMPVFDALGQRTEYVGPEPQASNLIKLTCNTMIATVIEVLSESFAVIKKTGMVDPKRYKEILSATVLSGSVFQAYGENILTENFQAGFKSSLALKDVELMTEASRSALAPMPIVALVRERLMALVASGHGDLDWSALALLAQSESGVGGLST